MEQNRDHEELLGRDHIYGHRDLDDHSIIYIDKETYANLQREIDYYRTPSMKSKSDRLKQLEGIISKMNLKTR